MTIIRNGRSAEDVAAISRAMHNSLESRRSIKAADERHSANGARVTRVLTNKGVIGGNHGWRLSISSTIE